MKYLSKVLLLCCGLVICAKSHAQSPPVLFDSTTTFIDYFNQLELQLNPADTGEGQSHSKFRFLKEYWMDRTVKNDYRVDSATNINMFTQYYRELIGAVAARQSAGCVTDKFSGNWRCIGPDTLPTQALGKVDDLWSDPDDSLHILAATVGGLFETTSGGAKWECITDNAIIPYGIMGIASIAVDPTNKNNIYLGTSGDPYNLFQVSSLGFGWTAGGAGILKSFDGGVTWETEHIIASPLERVQRIYITPDGTRLYAFRETKIYTRLVSSGTWDPITPPEILADSWVTWSDLEFLPGNQNTFFVVGIYDVPIVPTPPPGEPQSKPVGVIFKSNTAVPASTNWTDITPNINYSASGYTITPGDICIYAISVPDPDTLFAMTLPALPDDDADITQAIVKYNISGSVHSWELLNTPLV